VSILLVLLGFLDTIYAHISYIVIEEFSYNIIIYSGYIKLSLFPLYPTNKLVGIRGDYFLKTLNFKEEHKY
jgi:hypothetical protein